MIKALQGIKPEWWTPPGQEEGEEPARFLWKPLDGFKALEVLQHGQMGLDGVLKLTPEGIKKAVQFGVVDWENVVDVVTGEPIKFSYSKLGLIPVDVLVELAGLIANASNVDQAEKKTLA